MIADTLSLSSQQVEVAIRYIDEHRDEVTAAYEEMLARDALGNPSELQAKLDKMRGTARARLEELRRSTKSPGAVDERHSRGH